MDRRDFLKSIGLAGVALTLPKPLSVVAAKISDLEDPPIHAGYARFKIDRPFIFNDLYWRYSVNEAPSIRDYDRFSHGTSVSTFFGMEQRFSPGYRPRVKLSWENIPTSHIPSFPDHIPSFKANWGISFFPGEEIEIWCIPHKTPAGEPGKLLPVDWVIQGLSEYNSLLDPHYQRSEVCYFWRPMSLVRVERTRAIELGLIKPEEPEETFLDVAEKPS
jgi:hypothetical protein